MWKLIGCRGCGSVIVEAAFVLAGVPYEREEIDYDKPGPDRDRLFALNPLGQVPTLVAPDGGVMTESAAMVLHLDEQHPGARLLPPLETRARREALRWLIFIVASIYPTFTFGDSPEKFVGDAGDRLRASSNERRENSWRQVESAVQSYGGPWFMGAQRTMLDVYVWAMTHWRPRRAWFEQNAPALYRIATALDADPKLAPLRSQFA
ncbi:MAG TPA: glutathione S-transferase family protein [Kofleriaceae bacterium]|jgi:GST-like protein